MLLFKLSLLLMPVALNGFQTNHAFVNGRRSITTAGVTALNMADKSDVHVMVNGMPGPMAVAAAEACLRKGLKLTPIAMTGPEIEPMTITVHDQVTDTKTDVRLIPSPEVDEMKSEIAGLKEEHGKIYAVDFTHPLAVNNNALFYIDQDIPFVMGTTGGDRDKLIADVNDAKHFAVISPNMAKQIVAVQSALEDLAIKYPGAFDGYTLHVEESHQKTKADTSGTAKAVVTSLKQLNNDDKYSFDDIIQIRDDQKAMDFGVPENGLLGHAFHTYTYTSQDGSVQFQLKHNVVGRTIYAEGTADAIKFLSNKISKDPSAEGKVYTMINVLEAGALE